MQDIHLLSAHEGQIPEITKLATLVWKQYYPAFISMQQIEYMLGLMYSTESLKEQFSKKHEFYFIENNSRHIGFISVKRETNNEWFINKFYIDQQYAAKGIGSEVLRLLISKLEPEKMSLTVNRHNIKSINFYFKNGFTIERVADFDIGNGFVMNDFVMTWNAKEKRGGVF